MHIAIYGAGGVGGYFGARLAAAGNDVSFIARGAHLAAMREHGLRVRSPDGDFHLERVDATDDIGAIATPDLILVAVKLWSTEEVARSVRPLAERGSAVLSFQNGVSKDDILRRHLPASALMGGVSYVTAVIESPGVILNKGRIQRLTFGEFDRSRSARAEAFLAACQGAGFDADLNPDISRAIWEKFVFLVGLSATTATMRQPLGAILENPQTRAFLHDVMQEVVAVGRARGVALAEDFAQDRLAFCATLTPTMIASMAHDLSQGHRLELPWLSGTVVEYGRELGIPTPCNRAVNDILSPYVNGRP